MGGSNRGNAMHSIKWPEKHHRVKRVKQRRRNQGKCRENGGGGAGMGLEKGSDPHT